MVDLRQAAVGSLKCLVGSRPRSGLGGLSGVQSHGSTGRDFGRAAEAATSADQRVSTGTQQDPLAS